MKNEIKVENLNKAYQQHQAVSNFSFSLEQGKILGLLGPNGAGKSTTINILSTVLKPDSGKVTLCGYDLSTEKQKIKKCIGIVPQELAIYEEISAEKKCIFLRKPIWTSRQRTERKNRIRFTDGWFNRKEKR